MAGDQIIKFADEKEIKAPWAQFVELISSEINWFYVKLFIPVIPDLKRNEN